MRIADLDAHPHRLEHTITASPMTGIPPHDLPRILAARDDLDDLQRRVRERQAFPQSRGMQA